KDITGINKEIVLYENRLSPSYKKNIEDNLKKRRDDLLRIEKSKPIEIAKPQEDKQKTEEYEKQLALVNGTINDLQQEINNKKQELTIINKQIQSLKDLQEIANSTVKKINEFNASAHITAKELNLPETFFEINYSFNNDELQKQLKELMEKKNLINEVLISTGDVSDNNTLYIKLENANKQKELIILKASSQEKDYQKYLSDLSVWEKNKQSIIGDIKSENSIEYLKEENRKIREEYQKRYEELQKLRLSKIEEIYNQKKRKSEIYSELYKSIENTVDTIIGDSSDKINFNINFSFKDKHFTDLIIDNINLRMVGKFQGKEKAYTKITSLIKQTDCNDYNNIKNFLNELFSDIYNDLEKSVHKYQDKESYYNLLCSLDYVDIEYSLRMGNITLDNLSPGEKGILLLIFYLALNKEEIPLIIDQPEDNLDNQSVYNSLVPVICEAKKRRQIIIVTHNPNIAIACDAEQIIYSQMNKNTNKITYEAGSIENSSIRTHIIDVLEGTMPAFDLRTLKYSLKYKRTIN
ncbi:MAG: hypothetical protein LBO62_00045, partial [Endomicrobium sp.]|nr:hypothetical protein [Endomicrobium sp.]